MDAKLGQETLKAYHSCCACPSSGFAREDGRMSDEVLRRSFNATEEGFLAHVTRSWKTKPLIAAVGSCCLVGVIWGEKLFVANVGDSRAVMGSLGRSNKKKTAEQLTRDHNASVEEVREELKALHPDDSRIVVNKHGVWRVKGIIQVSRSIGDVYLKKPEFNLGPVYTRFQLSEPLHRPQAFEIVYNYPRAVNCRLCKKNRPVICNSNLSNGVFSLL
ncbi:hypothetical protein SUGI_0362830 [Cryptomeria japonica]|nr:hypothetical protein SUGI_0362830 [Cryptomeria japonica]